MLLRILRLLALLATASCSSPATRQSAVEQGPPSWNAALTDTLLRFGIEDQAGRAEVAQAIAAGDSAALLEVMRADSARSLWLRGTAREHGWPARSAVGDSAAVAAWLILQHSPLTDWQAEMVPIVQQLASRGELPVSNLALFLDRVRVRQGKPQQYGSQFDFVDGRLVPAPIEDLAQLDARRAAVGLPPMSEYVQMLREVYKLPVVWPPER